MTNIRIQGLHLHVFTKYLYLTEEKQGNGLEGELKVVEVKEMNFCKIVHLWQAIFNPRGAG